MFSSNTHVNGKTMRRMPAVVRSVAAREVENVVVSRLSCGWVLACAGTVQSVNHIDRQYLKTDGSWALEDSDTIALEGGKVDAFWNKNVDTVGYEQTKYGYRLIACHDTVSAEDRAAWNEVDHSIFAAERWAKDRLAACERVKYLAELEGPAGLMVGVTIGLVDAAANVWEAFTCEGWAERGGRPEQRVLSVKDTDTYTRHMID